MPLDRQQRLNVVILTHLILKSCGARMKRRQIV